MKKPSSTLLIVLAADLLAASGDITATWASPMYSKLYSNDTFINPIGRPISLNEDSWIGSIINIGSIIGALPAGYLADKIGRKWSLLIMAIFHITAFVTYAFATKLYWFLAARFWSGLAVGAGYALLPMYIAEVSEDSNRGALSGTLNIFWSFGNFLPYGMGPYLSNRNFNLILAALPTTFFIVFWIIAPESPEYLVHQGKKAEAEESLRYLRPLKTDDYIRKEMLKIEGNKEVNGTFKDLFKDKTLLYGFFVSLVLVFIMQLTGFNAINNYTQTILEDANIGISSDISSTLCGVWNFLGSFLSIILVKYLGRKLQMLISLAGSGLSTAALGVFYYVKNGPEGDISNMSWLPFASLLGFILLFNIGLAAIPWTFSSEVFPNNVKVITSAGVSAISWLASFLVTQFFNSLRTNMGEAGTFWLFTGFSVFGLFFCLVFMPETKDRSYNEIYAIMQKKMQHLICL